MQPRVIHRLDAYPSNRPEPASNHACPSLKTRLLEAAHLASFFRGLGTRPAMR